MTELAFDDRGLIPAIAQDAATGRVLMVAWMNAEALQLTRDTGFAHFYSRSRQAMWKKGETSGNTLAVREVRVDCDADVILLAVAPAGPACHTGAVSCFYRELDAAGNAAEDSVPGASIIDRLGQVLVERRDSSDAGKSYTKSLLDAGMPKILAKIAEESGELADELPGGSDERVVSETADLLFHVMVALCARDIAPEAVLQELARRFGVSGHVEKASRQ